MDDVDEMISLTNRIVESMNFNDRSEATHLLSKWRSDYLHRSEIITKSIDVMFAIAMVGHQLGFLDIPKRLTKFCGTGSRDLDDISDFLMNMGPGTMVDVGAQWGTVLNDYLWCGWRVLAFEPTKDSLEILTQRYGGFSNLDIDTRAVSNECQKDVTFYTGTETNVRSLHGMHDAGSTSRDLSKIEVTTLESAFKQHNIEHVMYLKIDVEGYELMVLQGVPWDEIRPAVIAAEYDNPITEKIGYSTEDMIQYMEGKGYFVLVSEWAPIVEYGGEHKWRKYTTDIKDTDPNSWGNLIAFENQRDYNRFVSRFIE
jgi:FkbM family methyltransferase